jgi:hypothetical protein
VEIAVAHHRSKNGYPDQRINTSEDYEVRDWAKRFGVDEDMVRTNVVQIGNMASDVERYLKDKRCGWRVSLGATALRTG